MVLDEVHTYRGLFGSHVAAVLRRLTRLVRALRRAPALYLLLGDDCQPEELVQ